MKRFADSIARQKRIRPPAGYATSLSVCRAFLGAARAQESWQRALRRTLVARWQTQPMYRRAKSIDLPGNAPPRA